MSFLVELPLDAYRADAFSRFNTASDFDMGTARALMWMSQLAYEVRDAPEKVDPVLRQWDLDAVDLLAHANPGFVPLASTRGLIASGHGAFFLAFAGTDPLALGNWITNFTLGARDRDAHFGFEAAVHAVWDDLRAGLSKMTASTPLFVTGHSLGGALAVIAAERIARELKIVPAAIYAYGAPRVGASGFCSAYAAAGLSERTFRLVHGHDIIPTVPPSRLGFRHVGRMLTCERAGRFAPDGLSECGSDDPPFAETLKNGYRQRWQDILTRSFPPSSRSGVLGWYQRYVLPPLIGDHLPDRYRRAFE